MVSGIGSPHCAGGIAANDGASQNQCFPPSERPGQRLSTAMTSKRGRAPNAAGHADFAPDTSLLRRSLLVLVSSALAVAVMACSELGGAPASSSPTPALAAIPTATPQATPTATAAPTATLPPDWNALPAPAIDAASLAKQLAKAEAGLRDPNVTGAQPDRMAHRQ